MAVTIAGQWSAGYAPAAAAVPQQPATASAAATTTSTGGDWLLAICAWRQLTAGQGVTVSVGDDAHNRWEPLGAPTGDSPAAGVTRVSIWYAPAARVGSTYWGTTTVCCAPTGPVAALAFTVLDVAGLNPWDELAFVPATGYALAAPALSLGSPVPLGGQQALAIAALASDLSTATISFTGTGWAALTGAAVSNGTDHTGDLELATQWKLITSPQNTTWGASAACDLAGIIGALVVNPAAPVTPNPDWPIVITEMAPGAGVTTPPSQVAWQSASARDLGFSVTQGQPYLLGGLQAAQGALVLDNPDLALTPPGAGVWAGTDSGTPVRVRAILPASATPHYVPFNGFLQQAPTSFDEQLRGTVQATLTDAYAYATAYLAPALQAEIGSEPSLYAYWPLTDPAGAPAASNRAPGNSRPLELTASKFGTTGVTAAFGASSGALKGDSGDGMFSQSGVPSSGLNGFSLGCPDSGYPPIAGGVTVEGWFQQTSTTPAAGNVLTLMTSVLLLLECQVTSPTNLNVNGHQAPSVSTQVPVTIPATGLWHLAVAFDRATYAIYVNGALAASGTWTAGQLPPRFDQVWVNGNWGTYVPAFGKLYNGNSAHVAVCGSKLPAARVAAHYQAGLTAFAGEYAHQRIERILGYTGLAGRRVIVPEAPGMPGGFSPPVSTPPYDITPMASMATLGGTIPSLYTPGTPGFAPSSGTQANSALAATAASTLPALFSVAPTGDFFYLPRGYATNQAPRWVLGDSTAGGEVPYQPGAVFPYDPGTVRNIVQITQPDTGTVTIPAISEAPSVGQYGGQSYQVSAYLQQDATFGYTQAALTGDLANWVAGANYAPRMRAQVTVIASTKNPALSPAAWDFVLRAAPGDMVTVNARPPTSPGAVVSVTARIVQVTRKLTFSPEGTEGSAQVVLDSAPEENTLTCDDPVRGLLSGQNALGW